MDPEKERFAVETKARTLGEVIDGADIFLGLSAGGVLKPEMVQRMAARPLILALANPEPEIRPEAAKAVKPDAVIATGRSDYPNQVNNVLCFPFIFRGALDVGATTITREMELAAVKAIAELAQAEQSDIVARAYGEQNLSFGPEYLIPAAVRPAADRQDRAGGGARGDGERRRHAPDRGLRGLPRAPEPVRLPVRPHHEAGVRPRRKAAPQRVVYAEGEDERVLRAVQVVVDEGMARPTLIGRPTVIEARIERLGLRLKRDARLRPRRSRQRSALPRVLGGLPPARRAQGRDARRSRGSRCAAATR